MTPSDQNAPQADPLDRVATGEPANQPVASGADAVRLARQPGARRLGRLARRPSQIPWRGWRAALGRTLHDMISDRISLVAAGCTFYAVLALFPAISMLISIYGLAFNPATVEPQLAVLRHLLPPEAFKLLATRVHQLVTQPSSSLGIKLAVSVVITLYSSATGTKSMLSALNMAYGEEETRSYLRFQALAFAMTIGAILAAVLGLAGLVALPAALNFVGLSAYSRLLIQGISFAVLLAFVLLALSLLYRFGPSRHRARWRWVTPGSVLATLLWLLVSVLFSLYVGDLASYDVTYGSLGAAIAVMMWFYVSVYVVLLGAELNAELELQTVRDSTTGPSKPIGKRGAFVADHVAQR
ncbi:MAG: YihY/virulence factor BrkB family protein [Acetobacteraceae bacterium]